MKIAVGLDLETTGLLDPENLHRIIELCMISYDFDTGAKLDSMTVRFNPGRPIDPKAQAVHGIAFESVAMCSTMEYNPTATEKVQQMLNRASVAFAHNGIGFDFPFLRREFVRIGKHLPEVVQFDTMLEGRWATPDGKLPNLRELAFACRVPYDPAKAHAATYDVEVMAACFFYAKKRGFFVPSIAS